MKKIVILLFLCFLLFRPKQAAAITDPLNVNNNYYGIHIMSEYDIEDAANLVNSSGGAWGYVTFVIREDQIDKAYWHNFFYKLNANQLIPIVRIATTLTPKYWEAPSEDKAMQWAEFLNSLPWPTKNRYVILFNEPNHAKEWGGEIDPVSYAKIARVYWQELKKQNDNFFVLPAALDLAAPNSDSTMSPYEYWDKMSGSDELIFTIFDGWNSHSYPNPGFSGKVTDDNATSIVGYKSEIDYLKDHHLDQNLPIFITETGWVNDKTSEDEIAQNYKTAFTQIWNEDNVVAVTPFVLGYNEPPFNKFSWKNPESLEFYKYYNEIQNLNKISGTPILSDYAYEPKRIAYVARNKHHWFVNIYGIWLN